MLHNRRLQITLKYGWNIVTFFNVLINFIHINVVPIWAIFHSSFPQGSCAKDLISITCLVKLYFFFVLLNYRRNQTQNYFTLINVTKTWILAFSMVKRLSSTNPSFLILLHNCYADVTCKKLFGVTWCNINNTKYVFI